MDSSTVRRTHGKATRPWVAPAAACALALGALGLAGCGESDGPGSEDRTPTTGSNTGGSEGLDNNGQGSPDGG